MERGAAVPERAADQRPRDRHHRAAYEATPFDDPKKGTHDEERRGPFPVGVAVEGPAPVEWFEADYGDYRKAATLTGPVDGGLLAACLTARAAVEPDKETKCSPRRRSGRAGGWW